MADVEIVPLHLFDFSGRRTSWGLEFIRQHTQSRNRESSCTRVGLISGFAIRSTVHRFSPVCGLILNRFDWPNSTLYISSVADCKNKLLIKQDQTIPVWSPHAVKLNPPTHRQIMTRLLVLVDFYFSFYFWWNYDTQWGYCSCSRWFWRIVRLKDCKGWALVTHAIRDTVN